MYCDNDTESWKNGIFCSPVRSLRSGTRMSVDAKKKDVIRRTRLHRLNLAPLNSKSATQQTQEQGMERTKGSPIRILVHSNLARARIGVSGNEGSEPFRPGLLFVYCCSAVHSGL